MHGRGIHAVATFMFDFMKIRYGIFFFHGATPVDKAGFEEHGFGQRGLARLGCAYKNYVLDMLVIIDFHRQYDLKVRVSVGYS